MKMETLLKVTILKMRREEKENIISRRVECYNLSSILIHLRFPKFTWLMVQFIQVSKKMVLGKVREKQFM